MTAISPSPQAILTAEDLAFSHGSPRILDGLSFSLAPGEVVGLTGLNGEGKTTVIRLCAGLLRPDRGRVRILGRAPEEALGRQALAYLPESHQVPDTMTGRDWITTELRVRGLTVSREEVEAHCADLSLDLVFLDKPIGHCSKGTRRKIALAGLLLADAPLTLLDEPQDGLDPRSRVALKTRLRAMAARGRTVLLSSHVLSELETLCDRLLLLHEGGLAHDGPPARLMAEEGGLPLEEAVLSRLGVTDVPEF